MDYSSHYTAYHTSFVINRTYRARVVSLLLLNDLPHIRQLLHSHRYTLARSIEIFCRR